MAWGIAWSALRQGGYQAVWTAGQYGKGRMMGLLWGMIRLGSAFSVVFGGYLRDLWGYRAGVLGVLGISALAIPVAASIAWPAEAQRISSSKQSFWQGWREALKTGRGRRLLLAASLNSLFEGVLIATASLFLARRLGNFDFLSGLGIRIGTIAGLLLALRWTSDILFAPLIGWLSDHLGQLRSLVLMVCVLLISLIGAVNSRGALLFFCLAFLFVSSAGLYVTLNALANGLSTQMERPHIYLGVYATAADCGSALGPLLAYSAGALISFAALYVAAGAALTAAIFRFCWLERKGSA
jgi:MFS family permease